MKRNRAMFKSSVAFIKKLIEGKVKAFNPYADDIEVFKNGSLSLTRTGPNTFKLSFIDNDLIVITETDTLNIEIGDILRLGGFKVYTELKIQ